MLARSLLGVQEEVADVGTVNARVTAVTRVALRRKDMVRHGGPARCVVRRREVAIQLPRLATVPETKPFKSKQSLVAS